MANYPQVQAKAQAELDAVLKNERLPTLDDRPMLPYFNAIIKEVLRWRPPVPLGVPRRIITDDDYQGNSTGAGVLEG
jgi:cytochrome P450